MNNSLYHIIQKIRADVAEDVWLSSGPYWKPVIIQWIIVEITADAAENVLLSSSTY